MAQEYNVTWQEYNGTDYDKLYPVTKVENVAVTSSVNLADTLVYGDPLRYNMAQQGLYFYKNDILLSRQGNGVNMLLVDKKPDYDTINQLTDSGGIPVLVSNIASDISVDTKKTSALLSSDSTIGTFTPDGGGEMSTFTYVADVDAVFTAADNPCQILIKLGDDVVWESETFNHRMPSGVTTTINKTFSPNVGVIPNVEYTIVFHRGGSGTSVMSINAGTTTISFTGTVYASGYFTTKQFAMTEGNKLQAWAYYTGSAPTVSYNVNSGSYNVITPSDTTASQFLDGTNCTQAMYEIDGNLVKNSVVRFKFDIASDTTIIKEMCGILL